MGLSLCAADAQPVTPVCQKHIADAQAIIQSAEYYGLIDNSSYALPTQLNPLYVIYRMDERGTRTNMLESSR
ncbi:MAG: hypothetical protein Q8L86_12460 [Vicinamibacterales bacterium]|nr:hypothetical protein [Vicinamibacterales bacterium]